MAELLKNKNQVVKMFCLFAGRVGAKIALSNGQYTCSINWRFVVLEDCREVGCDWMTRGVFWCRGRGVLV